MEHEWNRLLGGIPREKPPEIPVEALLEASQVSRRPLMLAAAFLLATGSLLALRAGSGDDTPPPVHLEIQVVQADEGDLDGNQPAEEFERP